MAVTYGDTASLCSVMTDPSHSDTRSVATSQRTIPNEYFEAEYEFPYDVLQLGYRHNYCAQRDRYSCSIQLRVNFHLIWRGGGCAVL